VLAEAVQPGFLVAIAGPELCAAADGTDGSAVPGTLV
jgi:hypothetical protein